MKPTVKPETLDFTRANNDVNGNPRYVVAFSYLLSEKEAWDYNLSVSQRYNNALFNAKKIGGKKFHNKQFGGGIVFQCYSLPDLTKEIAQLTGRNYIDYEVSR